MMAEATDTFAQHPDRVLPLSSVQRRFLAQSQLPGLQALNNAPIATRLRGCLDLPRLLASLRALVCRHEILRTRFSAADGGSQCPLPSPELTIPVIDLCCVGAETSSAFRDIVRQLLYAPFDLASPPLFRITLLRLADDDHVLHAVVHHIISDGWSQAIMLRELAEGYARPSAVPEAAVGQYSAYALNEHRWIQTAQFRRQREWWLQYLADAVPSSLPGTGSDVPPGTGRKHQVRLDELATRHLTEWGSVNHASPFMALLSGLILTLHQRTGERSHTLGLVTGFRDSRALENTLGCMTNIACIRASVGGGSVADLLRAVRDHCLDIWDHRDVPFEYVSGVLPQAGSGPLNVLFVHQPPTDARATFGALDWSACDLPDHVAAFPLIVMSTYEQGGICLSIEYDAAMYERNEIEAFARHLQWSVAHLPSYAGESIDAIPLGPPDCTIRLETPAGLAHEFAPFSAVTLHGLFEQCARRHPSQLAVIDKARTFDYGALECWAESLAAHLATAAVESEEYVGILCSRSGALVASWLGVMKSGAVAVPFDIEESAQQIAWRLERARIRFLLTDQPSDKLALMRPVAPRVFDVNAIRDEPDGRPVHDRRQRVDGSHLAYLIFTSGSTGDPKAVMGTHAGMVNRIMWMAGSYPIRAGERCAVRTSPAFVDSVCEILGPLCAGATLVAISEPDGHDPRRLAAQLRARAVERIVLVPSLLNLLLSVLEAEPASLPELKTWSVSGEPLPVDLLTRFRRLRPADLLLNLYGSSEVAADVTCGSLQNASMRSAHAGFAIDHCRVYVMDARLRPVPRYVEGDIYAAGAAVSRGYDRDSAATAEKFIPCPTGSLGERMYRTGDRGYFASDGALCIVGRRDRQIKRRGVRIDLDQIEAKLQALEVVAAAAAVWNVTQQGLYLVVEIAPPLITAVRRTAEHGLLQVAQLSEAADSALMEGISNALPVNWLPDRVMIVERIPRLPSGKIARAHLDTLDWSAGMSEPDSPRAGTPTPTERALISICESILERHGIVPDDRFLALGMTSVALLQLAHSVFETLHVHVTITDLYRSRSISNCARLIEAAATASAA